MPLEKRMPISQNENIGNFDLFSNITEGDQGGELAEGHATAHKHASAHRQL